MATKPLKTLTFEGLSDTYTIPQIDASLSTTGKAADAKATGDSLKEKASASGMVDMAKSLVGGKYTSDKQPYHFRRSPSGGAKDEVIVGGSLVWNQLVQNGNFESASGWYAGTTTPTVSNNIASYTATSDGTMSLTLRRAASVVADHKALAIAEVWCDSNNEYRIRYPFVSSKTSTTANTWIVIEKIGIVGSGETQFGIQSNSVNGASYKCRKDMLIDLTLLFGSTIADYIYSLETATAGAGVAWVKRYIDLDTYHEYDAGSIQSVEGLVSHDVVGFNQWDEEWEAYSTTGIQSKNAIPVTEGETYYIEMPSGYASINNVDKDRNYISYIGNKGNTTFTIPTGCKYIQIICASYGTTYNHDICINLSDPSRNGQYEPYEKHSYPLDSSVTLRGVPKLVTDHLEFDGDKYRADGSVERRYGIVDLGSLNWSYQNGYFTTTGISSKKPGQFNIICSAYPVGTVLGDDKTIIGNGSSVRIYITDSSYTDAATFKTAMSGIYLVYEKATPTTETAQPFQSPMIVGATEEYVSDSVVPVGHDSRYYEDITGKVNDLPSDFSTLIAPVEKSFTATRNYTVGSFVIVNNQLYKVTSAISTGGTITPNSNVTATTIMAEIMALA